MLNNQKNRYPYLWLQCVEMILGVSITAIGLSCMIKSGLGQTAITAFTQNITMISGWKSGSVLTMFFLACTLLQMILLKKDFDKLQLLQVVVALVQGKIVNVICYDFALTSTYQPQTYIEQWVLVFIAICLAAYGVAVLFKAELIKNPFEALVMVLAEKMNMEFSILRVRVDIFFMVLSLGLILLFQLEITTLREGTWASMFLLGRFMKYTFPIAEKTSIYWRRTHRFKAVSS